MESKEMQEIVNPQSGERIVIKKDPFWRQWKFWLYSVIAVLLMIVSVSSLTTACAAINAGVGSDKVDATSLKATKKEVVQPWNGYYYDGLQVYDGFKAGTGARFFNFSTYSLSCNYSSTADGSYSRYDQVAYPGNPFGTIYNGYITYFNSLSSGYLSFRYSGNLPYADRPYAKIDFYVDGVFDSVYELNGFDVLDEDLLRLPFEYGHYYWAFNHDSVFDAYQSGLEYGLNYTSGFYSVTMTSVFTIDVSQMNLYYPSDQSAIGYMLFTFWNTSTRDYFHVQMLPNGSDQTSLNHFRLVVCSGLEHTSDTELQVLAYGSYDGTNYVGNKYLNYSAPSENMFQIIDQMNIRYVHSFDFTWGGNVQNGAPYTLYQTGYDEGKKAGIEEGKAIGFANGAESVNPSALTDTLVAVFQQPFDQIYRFFNFNILGLNILGLVAALLTIFVVVKVIKKVF